MAAAAQVAQLVEHVTENHGVGGSIPPLGTNAKIRFDLLGISGKGPTQENGYSDSELNVTAPSNVRFRG